MVVTDVQARKQILINKTRYFICLGVGHVIQNCTKPQKFVLNPKFVKVNIIFQFVIQISKIQNQMIQKPSKKRGENFYSLLFTFYSLFVTFYSLLVIFYSLLVTFYSSLVTFTRYSLLFTRYSLLFTRYSIIFTRWCRFDCIKIRFPDNSWWVKL